MKGANTSQGLGGTEPDLSRSQCVTRHSEISRFVPERWPHFQKKVLEAYIFPECTRKSNANDIDFKNNFFLKSFGTEGSV